MARLEKGCRSVMAEDILGRCDGLFKGLELSQDEDTVCGAESERW